MDKPITVAVTGVGWLAALVALVTLNLLLAVVLLIGAPIAGAIAGTLSGEL